mgnify:CR=1 FL=1
MKYVEEITESTIRIIILAAGSTLLSIKFGWLVGIGIGLIVHTLLPPRRGRPLVPDRSSIRCRRPWRHVPHWYHQRDYAYLQGFLDTRPRGSGPGRTSCRGAAGEVRGPA